MKKSIYLFLLISISWINLKAQSIDVNVVDDATELAQILAGSNVNVYNATISGNSLQSGRFTYAGNDIGVSSGVVLSTGDVRDTEGPNSSNEISTEFWGPGDAALSAISGFQTYDAVELQFDFQVQSDNIEFSFIFGSDEYNQWVGSDFNDVFAFFISGPGIDGEENLALVPTTTDGITINTINNNSYWQFYNDNEFGMLTHDTEFDGFTTLLKAIKGDLIACEEYTLRLVIADGSDGAIDSGVFLQENSLVQGTVAAITQTPNDDDTAIEGCIKASFTFTIDEPQPFDTEIELEIAGEAINGVDYAYIDNIIVIPAGETEVTVFVDAFEDGLDEGTEDVLLIYSPTPCAEKDTVFLYIEDAVPIDYLIEGTNLTCNNNQSGEIDVDISGGYAPYWITITPEEGPSETYGSDELPVTGLDAGTYLVEVDDVYGCAGDAEVVGAIYDTGPTFLPDGNGEVYTTSLNVEGLGDQTLQFPEDLQSLCINMEHSFLGDLEMKLIAPDGTELILKERYNASDGGTCDLGEPIARAPKDGPSDNTDAGTGYDYCFTHDPVYGTMVDESNNYVRDYTDAQGNSYTDNYLPEGSYRPYQPFSELIGVPLNGEWTIWVKDHLPQDNGWIFHWTISFSVDREGDVITLTEPDPIDISLDGEVTQAACNESDGSVNIVVDGEFPAFEYLWSTGETTQNISGLSAGSYTVEVTDNNLCTAEQNFEVSNADGPEISAIITGQQCNGENSGSIETTMTGSITDVIWSNGETTNDIFNLVPGSYSIEVTDDQNCKSIAAYEVAPISGMYTSSSTVNETCGNKNGEIHLEVFGGAGGYTYLWSNGATTQNIYFLSQGTYTVIITDANGCELEESFTIFNTVGQCLPNCDLAINNSTIQDEICGDNNGQVNLSIFTSNTPHTVTWSNGEIGDNITNLSEGDYTATVSDAEGCEIIETYTVINDAGDLAISSAVVEEETCGNSNGSITINVEGGSGGYTYLWSNGATTQNLTNISEGNYSVTVTDGTGCQVSGDYEVINNTGSMELSFQYVVDEICNNGNGSIDINVSPISGNYSYAWNNGATTEDLFNLSAGSYYCVITNNSTGCQLTTPTYEVQNLSGTLSISNIYLSNEFCSNENGRIEVIVEGGEPDYNFSWSNGVSGLNANVIDNLSAGSYSSVITDQEGCSIGTGDLSVLNTAGSLSVSPFKVDESCGDGTGSITLEVSGGTPDYTYSWSTGETTATISNLSSGNYTYTVTDENDCSTSSSVMIGNNSGTLSIDDAIITNTECQENNGSIELVVSGGDGDYTYTWSNGGTTQTIENLSVGTYEVVLEDNSNCVTSASFEVLVEGGTLVLNNSTVINATCGSDNGSIEVDATGGANIQYNWSNGATTSMISGLAVGTYILEATSEEGCFSTFSFDIVEEGNCNLMCEDTESTSLTGLLYDSGGPDGNYSNNENCGFLIEPHCAEEITLSFNSFSVQTGYDNLYVYDGTDATGNLLLTGTGYSIPATVTATSGAMFLMFSSNGSIVRPGFEAEWTTSQYSESGVANFTASNINPAFGEEVLFTDLSSGGINSWSWDVTGNGVEDYNTQNPAHIYDSPGTYEVELTVVDCDGVTSTYTETIVVQGFPEINISSVDPTSYILSDCDATEIHTFTITNNGDGDLNWSIDDQLSFIITPTSGAIASGASIDVEIQINAVYSEGLTTETVSILSNDPNNNEISYILEIDQLEECFYLMCQDESSNESTGKIYDSGGPLGDYSNNEYCTFLIEPNCADEITLSFNSFNLQNNSDYLVIYDGNDFDGDMISFHTGNTIPASITATSGAMFLWFFSDNSGVESGFEADWSTLLFPGSATADFNVSNTNPAFGEEVFFTDLSSNVVTSWSWDVTGNGIEDYNTQNPSHIYDAPGTYDVELTVVDCEGTTTTHTETIVVQGQPEINVSTIDLMSYIFNDCNDTEVHTITISNTGDGALIWEIDHPNLVISPSSGTIPEGEDVDIEITINNYGSEGNYSENIVITSNDPDNPTIEHLLEIEQTVSCVAIMCEDTETTSLTGVLYDSGGPNGNYSDDENCGFLIQPPCADEITLTFNEFSVETNWDYLYVYDGTDNTGDLLLVGTGFTNPAPVTATSGAIFIQFVSDYIYNFAGFEAEWSTTQLTSSLVADFTASNTNPIFGEEVFFTDASTGNVLAWSWDVTGNGVEDYNTQNPSHIYDTPGTYDVELTVYSCGGVSDTYTQTIIVQDYPEISVNSIDPTSYQIDECENTEVHRLTISNIGSGPLSWTANHPSFVITPSEGSLNAGEEIDVEIIISQMGAIGNYNETIFINSNDPNNGQIEYVLNIDQTIDCDVSMCEVTESNSLNGTLYDSGGQNGNYGNNEDCSFLISPGCVEEIILSFNEFNVEPTYDILRVYDGEDDSGELLLTAHGFNIPDPVTATSGSMYLRFTSDGSFNYSGFEAQWNSVGEFDEPEADFTLSNANPLIGEVVEFTDLSSGDIISWSWDVTGNGVEDYNSQNTSHIYDVPGTYEVELTVMGCGGIQNTFTQTIVVQGYPEILVTTNDPMSFEINDCDEPEIHVFTISNNGSGGLVWSAEHDDFTLNPASGLVQPGESVDVEVEVSILGPAGNYEKNILIHSNDPGNSTVEHILEIELNASCGDYMCTSTETEALTGYLYDTGGPDQDYGNNESCSFLIAPNCANQITLTFDFFDSEQNFDFIRIYDGLDTSGDLILVHSGSTTPNPVTANSGSMYVLFMSDASETGLGFQAEWTTNVLSSNDFYADFEIVTEQPEVGEQVEFENLSVGEYDELVWNFGDGNESTFENPSHIYNIFSQQNCYDVSLKISKSSLCYSEIIKEVCLTDSVVTDVTFKIYPNPTVNTLNVEGLVLDKIEVFNVNGAYVNVPINKIDEQLYQLDFSGLRRATYFLRIDEDVYKIVKIE